MGLIMSLMARVGIIVASLVVTLLAINALLSTLSLFSSLGVGNYGLLLFLIPAVIGFYLKNGKLKKGLIAVGFAPIFLLFILLIEESLSSRLDFDANSYFFVTSGFVATIGLVYAARLLKRKVIRGLFIALGYASLPAILYLFFAR